MSDAQQSLQDQACILRALVRRKTRRLRNNGSLVAWPTVLIATELTMALEDLESCVETGDLATIVLICQRSLTFPTIRKIPFSRHDQSVARVTVAKILARVAEWLHFRGASN